MTNRLIDSVDPFIAVDGGGNCLAGPYLPFSLVRLSPDTVPPHVTHGYDSTKPIIRFSHTHVAGTGGGGRYGNIGVIPITGRPHPFARAYGKEDERAAAGYYAVRLLPDGILAELTSTPRVGVHRYTFPEGSPAGIIIDAGAVVEAGASSVTGKEGLGTPGEDLAISIGGTVEFHNGCEVSGRGDLKGGWGHHFPYSVYLYARFSQPWQAAWACNGAHRTSLDVAHGPDSKALLFFGEARTVELQVGISFVSVGHARASLDREAAGKSFDQIRREAEDVWEDALSCMQIETGDADRRKLFHTMLYRLLCMPTDLGVDDENPLWKSGVRQFTDYYCLWDSVRNANSFLALLAPELERDFMNSLLDIADHTGWVPDAWVAGHSAHVQGGCSADVVFSEGAIKGITGVDYEKALRLMRRNAEVPSDEPFRYGRYVEEYRDLGYLSSNIWCGSSRTIEYSVQDWCIGNLAAHLGQRDVARRYHEASKNVWNLWRDDHKAFATRLPNGSWYEPFEPEKEQNWTGPHYYEGSPYSWSFGALHELAGLVERHGGPDAFAAHLDHYLDVQKPFWKEIILHTPYLYHYAGLPHRSAERAREKLAEKYNTTRRGLTDNEDMGSQSTYVLATCLGLYPIMGQDIYLLTAPLFESAEVRLGESGKTLQLRAPGAGDSKPYIASVRLDGRPIDRPWLFHHELATGPTIEYEVASEPTPWGQGKIPPRSPELG